MWFYYSLFFAFWTSISVSISKRILKNNDVFVYLVFSSIFILFFMAIFVLFQGIPKVDRIFWIGISVASLINVIASLFLFKGIKIAPISLLAPLSAFNPVVATLLGTFFLNENIRLMQICGVLLVAIGTYLLNISDIKKGLAAPFRILFSNKGVQLVLLANILWGITPVFEKTAIIHTVPRSPLITGFTEGSFSIIVFLVVMLLTSKKIVTQFKMNKWWYILPAPVAALSSWAAFTAFSLTNIGYATSIFKLSTLFTILWGWIFFKEKRIGERLIGASVMILGTILLVL